MDSSGKDQSSENTHMESPSKHTPSTNTSEARPRPDFNPFIAFRRYADEQIASALQSAMGLPSMTMPLFSDAVLDFDDKKNKSCMRKAEEDVGRDSKTAGFWENKHWRPGHRHMDNGISNWDNQYRSSDFGFSSFFDGFPFNFGLPFLRIGDTPFDRDDPTWPLAYVLFSPYSPLHLERSQDHQYHGRQRLSSFFSSRKPAQIDSNEPRWRDAFEDLLRAANDLDLLDPNTEPERSSQAAEKWLLGMVQRGSLGNNFKLLGPETSPQGISFENFSQYSKKGRDEEQQPPEQPREERVQNSLSETELDLYDQFLKDITSAHERYSHAFADSPLMRLLEEERKRHMQQMKNSQNWIEENVQSKDWLEYTSDGNKNLLASQSTSVEETSAEPRVVSTMTRSVRSTLADGSISTKTVKTKRFADGREERDESVEVIPPPPTETSYYQDQGSGNEKQDEDSQGGSGWFWTR